jgi:hypothetical protein
MGLLDFYGKSSTAGSSINNSGAGDFKVRDGKDNFRRKINRAVTEKIGPVRFGRGKKMEEVKDSKLTDKLYDNVVSLTVNRDKAGVTRRLVQMGVKRDERHKIILAMEKKYGEADNRIYISKEIPVIRKVLDQQGISSQTKTEMIEKIKKEIKAKGKSEINSKNVADKIKSFKRNIDYIRYVDSQHETPLPSPAYGMKQNRKKGGKKGALKGALEKGGRKIYSADIGVAQAGEGAVVSMLGEKNNTQKTDNRKTSISQISEATDVAGEHDGEQDSHEHLKMAI